MKLNHILLTIGSVLLFLGLMVVNGGIPDEPESNAAVAEIISSDTTDLEQTISGGDNQVVTQPTSLREVATISLPIENVIWNDSFENRDSGWDQYYNVTKAKNYMGQYESLSDSRLYAWNGYQDNSYQIHLPGRKSLSSVMPYLWDFNTRFQLPSYPYRIRADVTVDPAGKALVFVDFSGDFEQIENGNGIAIIWGLQDGYSYKYVDTSTLIVYEFHQGQTWELACTDRKINTVASPRGTVIVDVDVYTIRITLYNQSGSPFEAMCDRVQPGQAYNTRYLGIGATYPQPMIPVNDYNMVAFTDIYVMNGESLSTQSNAPTKAVTIACDTGWIGGWDYESPLPIRQVLESDTLCNNEYGNFSSDFPGYGPERIAMPNDNLNGSAWECGGNAGSSRFQIWQEGDYLRLSMDNSTFYVFYAREIYEHIRSYAYDGTPIPSGYIVTEQTYGGIGDTNNQIDFVRIGDRINIADGYRFFFTVQDNNTLITNWTVAPCIRIQ